MEKTYCNLGFSGISLFSTVVYNIDQTNCQKKYYFLLKRQKTTYIDGHGMGGMMRQVQAGIIANYDKEKWVRGQG